MFAEKDEEKKAAMKETFMKETVPEFVKRMEGLLEKNGGKYLAGEVR